MPKQRPNARLRRARKEQRFALEQWSARESVRDDAKEHALKITTSWQKAVASIIETGRLLIEAKKKLPPGVYGSMFGVQRGFVMQIEPLIPFSKRTAERLMRIASHPVLCDATHMSRLPPSWGTLYVLSAMQPKRLKQLIAQGKVDADMTRKDATRFFTGPDIERLPGLLEKLNRMRSANPDSEELARVLHLMWCDDELGTYVSPHEMFNVGEWLCDLYRKVDHLGDGLLPEGDPDYRYRKAYFEDDDELSADASARKGEANAAAEEVA